MRYLTHILSLFFWCFLALQGSAQSWIENRGHRPNNVLGESELPNGRMFIEKDRIKYHFLDLTALVHHHTHAGDVAHAPSMDGHVFQMVFEGANCNAALEPMDEKLTRYHFFLSNDRSKWRGDNRSYSAMQRTNLYPGIDWKLYTHSGSWKYDFIVHAGADVKQIAMRYDGAKDVRIEDGRLIVHTSVGALIENAPVAWQWINGRKVEVKCAYQLVGKRISFVFPEGYNSSVDVVIDPQLIFASYSGSFANNFGFTATYDSDGNLYSGGSAFGLGYPTTLGAYQTTWAGGDGSFGLVGTDMALSKYAADGTSLIWSSYLGGVNDELPHSLICNSNNELLMYGTTSSPDFPTTMGAYDPVFSGGTAFAPQGVGVDYVNGSDIVITRFNSTGSMLIGSTFVGGTDNDGVNTAAELKFNYADEFRGEIDLDSEGNVVIASSTYSADFPNVNAVQSAIGGGQDAVLFKMSPDLTEMMWSTFLGGQIDDSGYSAAFDANDNVYLCGGTRSGTFPVTNGVYQGTFQGGTTDGWIAKIAANGQQLLHSTFLGSSAYDQLYFVDTDDDDFVHVYGQTLASGSEWIINAGWAQPNSGMLVVKLDPQLSTVEWSTVFGTGSGVPNLSPTAFLVDVCNNIYLSGWGGSVNASNPFTGNTSGMPITADAFQSTTDGSDFYVLVMAADASAIVYGSFFGGNISAEHVDGGTSRFDRKGIVYQSVCAGCANNDDFPTFPSNVVSTENNSAGCNNGVFKFDFQLPITTADFATPPQQCVLQPVLLQSTSSNAQQVEWNFGDGNTGLGANVTHTYEAPGTYTITLVAKNPATCNESDTLRKQITIAAPQVSTLQELRACGNASVDVQVEDQDPDAVYRWIPSSFLSNAQVPNPTFTPGSSTQYTLLIQRGLCTDTVYQSIRVVPIALSVSNDTTLCDDVDLVLSAQASSQAEGSIVWSDQSDFSNVLNDGPQDADIAVSVLNPTDFYCSYTADGCTLVDTVRVNLVSFQTTISGDFLICKDDTVQLSITDPNDEFIYTWQPSAAITSGQGTTAIEAVISEDTRFYVFSETPFDCTAVDSVLVEFSALSFLEAAATADPTLIVQGQSTSLAATPSGYAYQWTPAASVTNASSATTIATPMESTTYVVNVSDGECALQASVRVQVEDFVCGSPSLFLPNAFTPDANDKNEKLFVRGNNITSMYLAIYNRWGERVFESRSISDGWDGTYKGRDCDPAVYVYYLEVVCAGGATFKQEGNITLIR